MLIIGGATILNLYEGDAGKGFKVENTLPIGGATILYLSSLDLGIWMIKEKELKLEYALPTLPVFPLRPKTKVKQNSQFTLVKFIHKY